MLRLTLEIEVRDQFGNTRYKERQEVNSWVKAAAQLFESNAGQSSVTIKLINGSSAGGGPSATVKPFDVISGTANSGILVGTGSTAVAADDFTLETEIADGTATGELVRTDTTTISYELVLGTSTGYTHLMERTFTNSSGASITINEVGIVYKWGASSVLGVHDVLATGIVVLDNESVVVRYFTDWDV